MSKHYTMAEEISILTAKFFAAGAHAAVKQVRKYTGEPYSNHPNRVAERLYALKEPVEVVCAAHLHDVVEDTGVTHKTIEAFFGVTVAEYVRQVTNIDEPEDGNRSVRAEINRRHLDRASREGKTIKLADILDNMESIVEYDAGFAKVWMDEKRLTLPYLRGGNTRLFNEVTDKLNEYFQTTDTFS